MKVSVKENTKNLGLPVQCLTIGTIGRIVGQGISGIDGTLVIKTGIYNNETTLQEIGGEQRSWTGATELRVERLQAGSVITIEI